MAFTNSVLFLCWTLTIHAWPIEESQHNHHVLAVDATNVCIDQKLENVIVNVTYMQTMDVMEYTWCIAVPPRCPIYKQKLVETVKQENVSRLVNHRRCCPGYEQSDQKTCEPVCDEPCNHGVCFEPNVCSCTPGFSGPSCETVGCPEGNWGPNCANKCPCLNGGSCEANTGQCLCLPGWTGLHCQEKCDSLHYGKDCQKKCSCASSGETCYHVTGDCLPCPSGTYGAYCANDCSCNKNGTALCYHLNGNCFCHPNWYGPKCDLHCPFGYLNGVCYDEPMNNGTNVCSCPGDMYTCDPEVGCICKDNKLCQGGQQIFALAPLSAPENREETSSSSVAIIVTVLIIALLATILGVWYYKRRTNILQKDLQNRSVYYVENSILDPARHHHTNLMEPNPDAMMVREEPEPSQLVGAVAAANIPNNLVVKPRYEKNVNIESSKLGMMEHQNHQNLGACAAEMPEGGACGAEDSDVELKTPKKPSNINMYEDLESPVKIGSHKKTINSVIHNNLEDSDHELDGDDLEKDDVAISKMSNYLDSYPNKE